MDCWPWNKAIEKAKKRDTCASTHWPHEKGHRRVRAVNGDGLIVHDFVFRNRLWSPADRR
jgi:hypothetical protein